MNDFWFQAFLNTCWVALGVTLLSTLIALPAAWIIERTPVLGRAFFRQALGFSYAIPSFLFAVSWITLANPNVGWIRLFTRDVLGWDLAPNIYGLAGILFVESSCLFSILFMTFSSALRRLDASLEEAARLAGASLPHIFFRITLPLLKAPFWAGALSVIAASIASFGVPAMIGTPGHVYVLTTGIYSTLQQGTPESLRRALIIGLLMAAFSLMLAYFSRKISRSQATSMGARATRSTPCSLGALQPWANAYVFALWIVFFLLPAGTLILSSFHLQTHTLSHEAFGLSAWKFVFTELYEFPRALRNSLLLALSSAAVATLAAFFLVSAFKPKLLRKIESLSLVPYALPGTVLALFWILFFPRFRGLTLLFSAYLSKYFFLAFSQLRAASELLHRSWLESARLSGANFWQLLWIFRWPLLRPSLLAVFLLVFMPLVGELTLTSLLYGPGSENLGVLIFQLQDYADRTSAQVLGSLVLVILVVLQLASFLLPALKNSRSTQ